jgi:hypothetical protein
MTGKTGTEEFGGIDWEKTQKGADWRRGKGKGIRGERGGGGKKTRIWRRRQPAV